MMTIRTAVVAAIATFSFMSAAQAAPLNPNGFVSIGALGGVAITFDTDALTFNGGAGGVLVSQRGYLTARNRAARRISPF